MWTNFARSVSKDKAICKLCVNHELTLGNNVTNALKQHLKTNLHQNNVKDFENDCLDFPYALLSLDFSEYLNLIRKSAIREGKLRQF